MKKINNQDKQLQETISTTLKDKNLSYSEKCDIIKTIVEELEEKNIIERLPNEEFKIIPGTCEYYASNMGRVYRLTRNGERLVSATKSPNKTKKNYYSVRIKDIDGKVIDSQLHRVIAKTFIDESLGFLYKDDKRIVDHIDNNSENNIVKNLQIISQSENIMRAIYDHKISVGRPCRKCLAYNIETKETKYYESTGLLCREIFNSANKGYFNTFRKFHMIHEGWIVGYSADDIMIGIEKENIRKEKRNSK